MSKHNPTASSPSHAAQERFEKRYGAWLIDDNGREIPIDAHKVESCLDALSGSDDEFICYLAKQRAS